MSNSLPLVYISILNWNGCANTVACLNSLELLDYPNARIIVVDNASRDGSVQKIRELYPEVTVISSEVNAGYAGGHYLALVRAGANNAELFWMLNNDTLFEPAALSQLVRAYLRRGEAIYGSILLDPEDRSRIIYAPGFFLKENQVPDYSCSLKDLFVGRLYSDAFPSMEELVVTDVNGSSFLVPMSIVQKHGFLDTNFFLYGEETDYCYRLRHEGIPSFLVPASVVYHKRGGSFATASELAAVATYYRTRNYLVHLRKHREREVYLTQFKQTVRSCLIRVLKSLIGLHYLNHVEWRVLTHELRAVADAVIGRMGKTVDPEEYLRKLS